MKNKLLLLISMVVGLIVVGRVLTIRRQPGDTVGDETGQEQYEDLRTNILELIDEMDAEGLNNTQPDNMLSIEPFELDPENEELGGIY